MGLFNFLTRGKFKRENKVCEVSDCGTPDFTLSLSRHDSQYPEYLYAVNRAVEDKEKQLIEHFEPSYGKQASINLVRQLKKNVTILTEDEEAYKILRLHGYHAI
ncbi:hypothetical protein [Vibrio barjaei]|uniref:hypothetical protein n=1 Tax=Vibrio barjaei TaxID=1676683 RepID=UPI0022842228|nr:hypothetical protein [Vibrio barjaei]MCY9870381.1 hypothetical protein [Vibrio barjaei]